MHITRGGPRNQGELASTTGTRSRRPRPGAERKERSVICSLFPRIRLCTLPLFHYFFMSFFLIPKKKKIFFKSLKKKDISNMQILESSRPIMKCEHFLILHFQVEISTQKQALGNISKFTAYMCACVCVENSVCVCMCVRACALSAFVC